MTVEERNRLAEQFQHLNAQGLADQLFALLQANGDPGRIDIAWRLLVPKLQTELADADKPLLYSQIESLINGSALNDREKSVLVQMLGRIATPEALNLLLKVAQQDSASPLRQVANKMISTTGDVQWDGRFHEELSPVLEQAWTASKEVPGLREAVAEALAGVGAASGVELLLAEARRGGETVSEFSSQQDNLVWHVLDVFAKIRNPEAVPTLAARLGHQALDNLDLVVSGTALASMGRSEATTALLHWAESSKRDVGQLVEPWLSEARDPDSLALLEQHLADPTRFQNQENHKAVERALREWHARRSTTTQEQ
jgi:hypothetical protein